MGDHLDQIWCCSFDVSPTRDHSRFGDYAGAFVNVFVIADSLKQSRQVAMAALQDDHFIVVDEESDPLKIADFNWDEQQPEFVAEFESVRSDLTVGSPVQYGKFHTYPKSGLDA